MTSDRTGLRRAAAAALVLGLVAAPGCSPASSGVEAMPDLINVHAVLSPDDPLMRVIVERSIAINESDSPELAGIDDARVRIGGDGGAVDLVPAANIPGSAARKGTYLQAADMLPVLCGHTYRLTVETASGDTVSGETSVPSPFRIIEPADSVRIPPTGSLAVSWTASDGAFRYLLYAYEPLPGVEFDPEEQIAIEFGLADTTASLPFIFNRPGDYVVEVWAVDLNLYDYFRSRADRPEVDIINHLSGGIGLFGSRVARRSFLQVRD